MSRQLKNDKLQVDIAAIDYYPGQRFDHTGFITQVTLLAGGHRFCAPESPIPGEGTGGEGLCNEFGIVQAIGYDEAAVGEGFPKLGIGNLTRKNDKPYTPFTPYEVDLFAVNIVQEAPDRIVYTVAPKECRGYALRLTKTISLADASLQVAYQLDNVGAKPVQTEEYIHNFVRINDEPIGPDYALTFAAPLELLAPEPELVDDLIVEGDTIRWRKVPDKVYYTKLAPLPEGQHPYTWELRHEPSRLAMREVNDFPVASMALWGTATVVSPEIFIAISLEPGETLNWTRRYDFYTY